MGLRNRCSATFLVVLALASQRLTSTAEDVAAMEHDSYTESYAASDSPVVSEAADTCLDPMMYQQLMAEFEQTKEMHQQTMDMHEQTKEKHSVCENKLVSCEGDAVTQEELMTCQQTTSQLQQEKTALEGSNAQLTAQLARALEDGEQQSQNQQSQKPASTYLFSKDQLMEHVNRVCQFKTVVWQQLKALPPLKNVCHRMTEAKVEMMTSLEQMAMFQKIQPHCRKTKEFVATQYGRGVQLYQAHIKPVLGTACTRGKVIIGSAGEKALSMVNVINDKLTVAMEKVFHSELKEFVPEKPLDRAICVVYLQVFFFITLRIIFFLLRPVKKLIRCCCCRKGKGTKSTPRSGTGSEQRQGSKKDKKKHQ
eukprot:Selendium_serpulae@DN6332_c0_g1_i16.p1